MKKHILLFFLFFSPIVSFAEYSSQLETSHFSIKIIENCSEGNVDCNNVSYTGTRKKDNAVIHLSGKTMNNPKTLDFQGYEFRNGNVVYYIYQNGTLEIMNGSKLLFSEDGEWEN